MASARCKAEFGRCVYGGAASPGKSAGIGTAHGGEREDERLHSFELEESAFNPVDQHGEPQHHRERLPEPKRSSECAHSMS